MWKNLISKIKIYINNVLKIIQKKVYWVIVKWNTKKTSNQQQVEQLGLGLKNLIIKIYKILKTEYWPYRYYFLIWIIVITTFTLDMITWSRMIRFVITCIILLIYKKMHDYIEKKIEFNAKNIKYWMRISILINPVLYIVWKWDIYIYPKIDKWVNNIFYDNIKIKKIILIIIWNISIPIKIVYLRFYKALYIIKISTIKEFMFNRVYGLIISILILSDIIKYIYGITGGFINTIIYIYIIIYIINILYILYFNYKKNKNFKVNKYYNLNFIKKTIIYKIVKDYIDTLMVIEINMVFEYKIKASLIGNYIKNSLKGEKNLLKLNLEKMPEQWRFWINDNRIFYETLLYISYKDDENMSKILNLQILNILKEINFNNNYKVLDKYHDTYLEAIHCLNELFEVFESVLFYKYYVYEKGAKDFDVNNILYYININEYEYIYKMYVLILKNILFYIWSFEYYIFQDTNKITKLNVIEDELLEYGYHIYPKDINNFNPYDTFKVLVWEKDFSHTNIKFNKSSYIVNESIKILSRLTFDVIDSFNILIYIESQENKELKDIILLHKKYISKFDIKTVLKNDVSVFKSEITKRYFMELNNVMHELYIEWELNYMEKKNILEKNDVLLELIQYYKNVYTKISNK